MLSSSIVGARHRRYELIADSTRRSPNRSVGQKGISLSGRSLAVNEQPPDDGEVLAAVDTEAGEGMPERPFEL